MSKDEKSNKALSKPPKFLLTGLIVACLVCVISISARLYSPKGNSGVKGYLPQHIGDRISPCKEPNGVQVNKELLEAVIEKYRRGEPVADGIFLCREAFPTLKKYALDPDPNVRRAVTGHLGVYYSPEALQVIVQQIEKYPSDPNGFPAVYAGKYPCHFFRKIKVRSLTQALTTRIKSRDNDFQREEIYLLGCLAPKDPQAREFLEQMSQPSFPLRLSESDRQALLKLITYALAEDGFREAEEKVLAEIEEAATAADVESVLYNLKGFTNCRIIQRFARLILDKRPVSFDVADEGRIKQVQVRIGDLAILTFTSIFGTKFTGTGNDYSIEYTRYTDAEMERIYQRVKRALDNGKFSTCR